MTCRTLLTIATDHRLVQLLRWQFLDHEDGGTGMTVAGTVEEACSLYREQGPSGPGQGPSDPGGSRRPRAADTPGLEAIRC